MTIGIYRFMFSNGMSYIGQSNNIENRIASHYKDMSNGTHKNRKVRHHVVNYGMPCWEVLEVCPIAALNGREIYWISNFNSYNNGLNLTSGGGYPRPGTCAPSSSTEPGIEDSLSLWQILALMTTLTVFGGWLIFTFPPIAVLVLLTYLGTKLIC